MQLEGPSYDGESNMLVAYLSIFIFMAFSVALGVVALTSGKVLGKRLPYAAKDGAYECGFDPIEQARLPFDVRYYLVAILFILFDLETAFLFPWAKVIRQLSGPGFWAALFFLAILLVGFVYEWKQGALEWQ